MIAAAVNAMRMERLVEALEWALTYGKFDVAANNQLADALDKARAVLAEAQRRIKG